MLLVGIDIETTGTVLELGHRLVQVAAATADGLLYCSDVGQPVYEFSERSLSINGFDHRRIVSGPDAREVDAALAAWLTALGAGCDEHTQAVAVGFNVASFDLAFIAHELPHTARLLSHRAVELNSLCTLLGGLLPGLADRDAVKVAAKAAVAERLGRAGVVGVEHDAGYDAALAIGIYAWLREQVAALAASGRVGGDGVQDEPVIF